MKLYKLQKPFEIILLCYHLIKYSFKKKATANLHRQYLYHDTRRWPVAEITVGIVLLRLLMADFFAGSLSEELSSLESTDDLKPN